MIYRYAYIYALLHKLPHLYKLKELLTVLNNMISGKIYFRKEGKGAVINLSGDEIEKLKMKSRDSLVVRLEEEGTKLILKQEKSIKI